MGAFYSSRTGTSARDELSFLVDHLERADQRLEPANDARVQAVADARTVDLALDDARVPEDLEMLRDGRLRERELVDDLTADARPPPGEEAHDLDARRVRERLGEPGELLVGSRA